MSIQDLLHSDLFVALLSDTVVLEIYESIKLCKLANFGDF